MCSEAYQPFDFNRVSPQQLTIKIGSELADLA